LVIKALDADPYRIRIRIGIQPKMLDPDPDEINADPQPWSPLCSFLSLNNPCDEEHAGLKNAFLFKNQDKVWKTDMFGKVVIPHPAPPS
jgi:hypothetical protein